MGDNVTECKKLLCNRMWKVHDMISYHTVKITFKKMTSFPSFSIELKKSKNPQESEKAINKYFLPFCNHISFGSQIFFLG